MDDSRDERLLWLACHLALAEAPHLLRRLRVRFPRPAEAFAATESELREAGLDEASARRFLCPRLRERAKKEFDRLDLKGYSLLTLADLHYPLALREIYDPPAVLYCAGRTEALNGPLVAVVGAREPSAYGKAVAERLAADLAARGLGVVSGLARGIDAIAHQGALQGGYTVAVLGSGLDNVYPPENRGLFGRIVERGAVVSEYALDADPLAHHFPWRNRIISGLSLGVVVIEATLKSGSLITAHAALEQNREVMAVPGPVTSGRSRGTHWLIKNGAKLVEGWEDVAEELPGPVREAALARPGDGTPGLPLLTEEEAAVWGLLAPDVELSIDDVVERGGLTAPEALDALLRLEIKDLAAASPGHRYRRKL